MTTRTLISRSCDRFIRLACAACFILGFTLSLGAAEAVKKSFNLPAGDAAATLKAFTQQSGEQIVYPVEQMRGVKTNAVKGELATRAALDQMLDGTGLVVVQDEKTGALAVRRDSSPNGQRAAQKDSARPDQSKIEGGKVVLDTFEVTGRIDGLNNKGLLQGGAEAPLYHSVIDREEIERLGVTSLEELFRLIPQTSSPVTSLQNIDNSGTSSGGLSTNFATTGLRGFSSSQTVILVNGRALPRSSRLTNGGADLARIPLAAIQRIEIMPYSGSAIYGSGAIGGAINIILRKDYAGRDVTAYLGTSTAGGGTEYRVTYLEGRTFNSGRTHLALTLSYQHRDPVYARDRGFIDQLAGRFAVGSENYFRYTLPALASTRPVIYTTNPAGLGIPGAGSTRFATIPTGTDYAASLALTPASFTATAGTLVPSFRYGNVTLYNPGETYSANAQLEHVFVADKLEGYAELTYGRTRRDTSFPQALNLTLSATDPLNPFRTNAATGFTGRSVVVYLDPPDVPLSRAVYDYENVRAVVGLKGKLTDQWDWSFDVSADHAESTVMSDNPQMNILDLNRLTVTSSVPGPAASAAVRRAVYPLLADHLAFPIPRADVATYYSNVRNSYSDNTQYEANARVTGDLFELPAGWLRSSVFGKYRDFELTGGQYLAAASAYSQLINNGPRPRSETITVSARQTWQGAVELEVPVISKAWRPVPVQELLFNFSVGYERNITTGEDTFFHVVYDKLTRSANTHVAAVKLSLTPELAFRGSYSDAVYTPDWDQTGMPQDIFDEFPFEPDPKRGNTLQTETFQEISGGSPTLKSERSTSRNFGLIFKPRFVKGLTLTLDWWDIRKKDAIDSPVTALMYDRPQDYPGRVVRAAPTAADLAKGWDGILLSVDTSFINIGLVRTSGADLRLDYRWETKSWGTLRFDVNSSFTNHYRTQQAPGSPEIELSGASGPVRWRGYGTVGWSKGGISANLTARYVGHYRTNTTAPSDAFPNATGIDGGRIPAFMRYDLQAGYEFPYNPGAQGAKRWLSGTKWTVGALNFLNEAPSFVTNGSSYYNRYDDVRQRYIYTQIRKSF